ncbi:MAG: sigma 54-interacting transcriptional regulator [Sandaracinaceae bacterium]|nr:sigma 54-interacting transcriptional regulator [Sandaracinaceae bacterium]
MARDGETTIRGVAAEEVIAPIVFLRLLYEPEAVRPRPATPLGRHPMAIGRAPELDGIVLRDPKASRRHAVFHPLGEGTGVRVEDVSTNGTFVNGARIEGHVRLADNDVVRVGDSFVLVRISSPVPGSDADIPELEGRHPAMRALRRTIASVAPTEAKVLIQGETGTGKELVARAIHERSGRRGRFVPVNCAAIPESLAESQLFGHVAGAFTGAAQAHEGFGRAADGGTLFLDEIGELPPTLQPKLLRALEERRVVPVGTTSGIDVDVRLIAATHRDLLADVDAGRFRADLYSRVAGYLVHTLPLRERREDILPLLERFLGPGAPKPSADLIGALLIHPYRFNVRELKEIAWVLRIDGAGASELALSIVRHRLDPPTQPAFMAPPASGIVPTAAARAQAPQPKLAPPSREEVEGLMQAHGGNVSQVARALGRSRRQVYRYLELWGIEPTEPE